MLFVVPCVVGCGGGPTAPPPPTPVPFINVVGGWVGTLQTSLFVSGRPTESLTCNSTWVVTRQNAGQFFGTHQETGAPGCPVGGDIAGETDTAGQVSVTVSSVGVCSHTSGELRFVGVLTFSTLTAQRRIGVRCTGTSIGDFDAVVAQTVAVNRR